MPFTDRILPSTPYASDVVRPDMLHALTLRSGIARGKVQSLARDPAFDWSRIVLLEADDVADVALPNGRPLLAGRDVCHREEALLLVAADTRAAARAALAAIDVRYTQRNPVESISEALTARLRVCGEGNVHAQAELHAGDPEALERADAVIERTWSLPLHDPLELEPRCVVAEPMGEGVRIWCAADDGDALRGVIADALRLDPQHVDLVRCRRGGVRRDASSDPVLLAVRAALLARKAGRPVRLALSRAEEMAVAPKRPPAEIRIRCGVDADGRPIAWHVDALFDGGAWPDGFHDDLAAALGDLAGPWNLGDHALRARLVATNTPPNGGTADAFRLPLVFALQRHLDVVAATAGVDALALRRELLTDEHARAFLDRARSSCGFDAGAARGTGAAIAGVPSGDGGHALAFVALRLEADPATLVLKVTAAFACLSAAAAGRADVVETAVAGGVADAVGLAGFEELVSELGGVSNAGLGEYVAPTAADLPRVRVELAPSAPRDGGRGAPPLRIDALLAASLARCAAAPAFAAAASSVVGFSCEELPLTPAAVTHQQGQRQKARGR